MNEETEKEPEQIPENTKKLELLDNELLDNELEQVSGGGHCATGEHFKKVSIPL